MKSEPEVKYWRQMDSARGLSRADDLARELQAEIVTGRIALGSRLRQEDLAARFGVSRTPVREALRQLQAIGLVEQLGHRGALVRKFSAEECRNVYLVRAEREGLAAERAAGRLTGYDRSDIEAAQALLRTGYDRYGTLGDDDRGRAIVCEQWSQANELYHNVILAAAACPPLRDTVQSLQNMVPRSIAWRTFADDPEIIPRSADDHDRITEALVAGDARRARRLLHTHVLDTGETAARWLDRQTD
jgi:DNA-binding GntR family transcriptional regulator